MYTLLILRYHTTLDLRLEYKHYNNTAIRKYEWEKKTRLLEFV